MITKDELDKHIKATGRAMRENIDRKKKNEHDAYCFDCTMTGKQRSWLCHYDHYMYMGNIVALHNMLRFMLRINRTRKTLTNKFGRPKNPLPRGFDPDIEDRLVANDIERHYRRTQEGW